MIEEIPAHLLRPRVLTHSLIIKSFKKNYRRNFLYFNRKIFISGNKRKPISQKSKKRKPANLPAAPFRLSQSDMKIADMRVKNVCVPLYMVENLNVSFQRRPTWHLMTGNRFESLARDYKWSLKESTCKILQNCSKSLTVLQPQCSAQSHWPACVSNLLFLRLQLMVSWSFVWEVSLVISSV